MKTALYVRVSTEEQLQGTSLQDQINQLKRKAEYEGWDYQIYKDEGISGTTADREGFKRLMLDARAKRFEVVAVTKLDRFMRKLRLLLEYIHQLDQAGVTFVSVGEGFDTSNYNGMFSLHMMGVIAEWERERIIDRVTRGRHARYAEGKWGPGQPLYGYRYNRTSKKLEIREDQARVVKRIYNLFVYDRLGLQRIARLLNKERVKPRHQARQWYAGAIRDMVRHSGYKGEHPQGVEIPSIVEPPLWQMAQQRRTDNKSLHRRDGSPWLLQGLVKCGVCGRHVSCGRSHNARRVYTCRGRLQLSNADNKHKCSLKPLDAKWLESAIWDKVTDAFSNPTSLITALDDYIGKLQSRKEQLESELKPIDTQLNETKDKLKRLALDWVVRALGPEIVKEEGEKYEADIARLTAIRGEIDPAQLEELELTKNWLKYWEVTRKQLDLRLSFIFDNEPDEAQQQKYHASEVAKIVLGFASLDEPNARDVIGSPTSQRQLLDYLQCTIVPYSDRIDIKALFPISNIDYDHKYDSNCRLSHYPQSQRRGAAGESVIP